MLAPRLTEYRFTDVTQAFLQAAEREFTGQGILCTSLRDIEQAPGGKGTVPASVELVVAANVLPAKIGRANVGDPVTKAQLVSRMLLETKRTKKTSKHQATRYKR